MSKIEFASSLGATCTNPYYAWSYINEKKKFVLFGAWKHLESGTSQKIFSRDWIRNPYGKKNKGFAASLRHIDIIIEEGFQLRTFSMTAVPGTENGIVKTQSFTEEYESRSLRLAGQDYWADKSLIQGEFSPSEATKVYVEGDPREVRLTIYERNPEARQKCLEYYGCACFACKFDFGKVYGERGSGFIHVHHLIKVSERKSSYEVNPIKDLRPLCPNCHAIVHLGSNMLSIEELIELLGR